MLRYKEIKNMLIDLISQLHIGEKLPSRPKLCLQLDTTRATLDKAINELVKEGILTAKDGSGTYVSGGPEEVEIENNHWGVIVPDIREGIYNGLVRGIENIARTFGVNIILCNSDSDSKLQEQYIKRLRMSGVSGFIIVPTVTTDIKDNYNLYSQLMAAKVPFVFCNRNVEGISVPAVTSNDFYGAFIATKHLLAQGYRNIAYIARTKYKTSIDRCQGYLSALIESNVDVNRKIIYIEEKDRTQPPGYLSMKQILASQQPVDAVFCFNDTITIGVYQAIAEAGLRVSDDIGVIGYDNLEMCKETEPSLSSVAYKNIEIGEKAAEILWKQINKEPMSDFEYYLMQPEIVERDSCKGPRGYR